MAYKSETGSKEPVFSFYRLFIPNNPTEMSDLSILRKEIRKILSEMVQLNEAQKKPEVDEFINSYFTKANFFIQGEPVLSEKASSELSVECADELRSVISQMQNSNLTYENFYILKLSEFLLHTQGKNLTLSFENPERSKDSLFKEMVAKSFVVYVYHDIIFRVLPYNENFSTDAKLEAEAEKFIKSPEFDLIFGTEKQRAKFVGEIKTLYFEKKIKVFTNYFNPVARKKEEPYAIAKKAYRANTSLVHKVFGTGTIKAAEKFKNQGEDDYYMVQVDFPKHGIKKIKMPIAD